MSDLIRILPPDVSGQIAAGEVVQRPASVVKEMMENAIDAGADEIQVLVTDGGRTSIRIIDNGCGMSAADAELAFTRHATSKISTSEDLYSLTTFGFRGEALASIAAVAHVELLTRRKEDELGTRIVIHGGSIVAKEAVACPEGSSFQVSNLFYNVPARRKFLKSNQVEMSHIMTEIERVTIANPDVSFDVYSQQVKILSLPAAPQKQRIIGLFGKKVDKELMPLSVETSMGILSGFVGSLDSVRRKCNEQFFFVNGRYMRHPYFHKAVIEPYENLIPQGEQPPYFIFFEVPADSIDVNIHPAKTEIKFSEEQSLWKILNAVVRETLGRFESMPSIDFNVEDMPDIPVYDSSKGPVEQPRVKVDSSFNPFKSVNSRNWSALFEDKDSRDGYNRDNSPSDTLGESAAQEFSSYAAQSRLKMSDDVSEDTRPVRKCLHMDGGYIITIQDGTLFVIDQRKAHIRVLYDRYMRQLINRKATSEGLLFPEMFQLSAADSILFGLYWQDLQMLGFDLSDMGHGAVALQGVPSGLNGKDYGKLLVELLHARAEGESGVAEEKVHSMALCMARRAAVPKEKILTDTEMNDLVNDLSESAMPSRTPDGERVILTRSAGELDGLF